MFMKDWRKTIDNYLWMTRRDILTVQENVTHQHALEKAHLEYEKYKRNQEYILSPVECHFFDSIGELDNSISFYLNILRLEIIG